MFKFIRKIFNKAGVFVAKIDTVNDSILKNKNRLVEKYYGLIDNSFHMFCQYEGQGNQKLDGWEIELIGNLYGTGEFEAFFIRKNLLESIELEGEVCEFGVAQGATSCFISYYLQKTSKRFFLFDSFQGLSKPSLEDKLIDDVFVLGNMSSYEGKMAFAKRSVINMLWKFKLNLQQIHFVEGFIEKTYSNIPDKVCFSYIDFDFYQPIKIVLNELKSKLVLNGIAIVDDYGYFSEGAKKAVDEFINQNLDEFTIHIPPSHFGHFCILKKIK